MSYPVLPTFLKGSFSIHIDLRKRVALYLRSITELSLWRWVSNRVALFL